MAATASCIAVGTRNPADGSVSVLLTADEPVVGDPAFDGFLDSPDHEIRVENVDGNECAVVQVEADRTRVRVYADDLTEPTRVAIHVG